MNTRLFRPNRLAADSLDEHIPRTNLLIFHDVAKKLDLFKNEVIFWISPELQIYFMNSRIKYFFLNTGVNFFSQLQTKEKWKAQRVGFLSTTNVNFCFIISSLKTVQDWKMKFQEFFLKLWFRQWNWFLFLLFYRSLAFNWCRMAYTLIYKHICT